MSFKLNSSDRATKSPAEYQLGARCSPHNYLFIFIEYTIASSLRISQHESSRRHRIVSYHGKYARRTAIFIFNNILYCEARVLVSATSFTRLQHFARFLASQKFHVCILSDPNAHYHRSVARWNGDAHWTWHVVGSNRHNTAIFILHFVRIHRNDFKLLTCYWRRFKYAAMWPKTNLLPDRRR